VRPMAAEHPRAPAPRTHHADQPTGHRPDEPAGRPEQPAGRAEQPAGRPEQPGDGRPAAYPASPARRPRASLWVLRTIAVGHCGVIAAQPVFAGIFLTGDVDAIAVHEMNSHLVSLLGWSQIIAALVYATRGRGRWSPMWFSLALALAEETQKVFGYLRLADLHIPVGVSLITIQVLFTVWLFRPDLRQARVDKARRGGRVAGGESRTPREPYA
jgi:hypothetical protein